MYKSCVFIQSAEASVNKNPKQISGAIKAEIKERTTNITVVYTYISWVLSLTALFVVVQSYLYLKKYLKDDKHDNAYITDSFVAVDSRRSVNGKLAEVPYWLVLYSRSIMFQNLIII